mmetsp:Transcript_84162/g.191867  ORF Transcript_84162/g.191867 Transcript_84162/m.191867 type:complete len:411 (-) Transcript_84162:91-1323(-)
MDLTPAQILIWTLRILLPLMGFWIYYRMQHKQEDSGIQVPRNTMLACRQFSGDGDPNMVPSLKGISEAPELFKDSGKGGKGGREEKRGKKKKQAEAQDAALDPEEDELAMGLADPAPKPDTTRTRNFADDVEDDFPEIEVEDGDAPDPVEPSPPVPVAEPPSDISILHKFVAENGVPGDAGCQWRFPSHLVGADGADFAMSLVKGAQLTSKTSYARPLYSMLREARFSDFGVFEAISELATADGDEEVARCAREGVDLPRGRETPAAEEPSEATPLLQPASPKAVDKLPSEAGTPHRAPTPERRKSDSMPKALSATPALDSLVGNLSEPEPAKPPVINLPPGAEMPEGLMEAIQNGPKGVYPGPTIAFETTWGTLEAETSPPILVEHLRDPYFARYIVVPSQRPKRPWEQ